MPMLTEGVRHMSGHLDRATQEALVEDIRTIVEAAPLYVPTMPKTGKPMVDLILDKAGQKGTGRWSVIEAQQMGVPGRPCRPPRSCRGTASG